MRDILQFYRSFFGNLTAFMVFSFFVSGCHTGEEPVSVTQVTVKKEATNRNQAGEIQADSIVKTRKKKPETPVNHGASGILLPEKQANKNMIYDSVPDDKNLDAAGRRDPFALPAALRKQQTVTRGNKCVTSGNTHFEAPMKKLLYSSPQPLLLPFRSNHTLPASLTMEKTNLRCFTGRRYREPSAAANP